MPSRESLLPLLLLALASACRPEPTGREAEPDPPLRDLDRVEELAADIEARLAGTWLRALAEGRAEPLLELMAPEFAGRAWDDPPLPEAGTTGLVAEPLEPARELLGAGDFARHVLAGAGAEPRPHERGTLELEDLRIEPDRQERAVARARLRQAARLGEGRGVSLEGHLRLDLRRAPGADWLLHSASWEGGERVAGRASPFVDVTSAVGLHEPTTAEQREHLQAFIDRRETLSLGGLVALDWNGDGFLDLLATREDQDTTLFLNDGESGFLPADLPLEVPRHSSRGFLWLDLDGDGLEELVSTRVAGYAGDEAWMDLWTRSTADGGWEHRPGALRFPNPVGVRRVAPQWHVPIDADGDGLVELFTPVYGDMNSRGDDYNTVLAHDGGRNPFFVNEGDLVFREASAERGLEGTQYTFVALAFDLDGDGDQDLWEGNDFGPNIVWTNDGRGSFARTPDSPLVAGSTYTMGVTLTDVDGSGAWSLYISNMSSPVGRRLAPLVPGVSSAARERVATIAAGNMLFRSDRGWQRVEAGLDDARWAWGCVWFDLENDGDQDLVVTNGFTSHRDPSLPDWDTWFWRQVAADAGTLERGEPMALLDDGGFRGSYAGHQRDRLWVQEGVGSGTFHEASWHLRVDLDHDGRAVVPLDVDGDGDLDLAYQHLLGLRLLLNTSPPRSFLRLDLRGAAPATHALGAVVTVEAGGRRQRDRVRPVEGFHSQLPRQVHFGLGDAARVERVLVEWPDGSRTELRDLPVDVLLEIEQHGGHRVRALPRWSAAPSPRSFPAARPGTGGRPLLLVPEERLEELGRALPGVLLQPHSFPEVAAYDATGALARTFPAVPSKEVLLALVEHLGVPADYPDLLVQRAREELAAGRPVPADALFERALAADPRNPFAHEGRAEARHETRRLDEAEESYRRALELDPDYGLAHYNLGVLLAGKGELEAALVSLREAGRLLPHRPEVLLSLGEVAALAGHEQEALRWLELAAASAPDAAAPLVLLGKLHGLAGRYAEAAAAFGEALVREPGDGEARAGLQRSQRLLERGRR